MMIMMRMTEKYDEVAAVGRKAMILSLCIASSLHKQQAI